VKGVTRNRLAFTDGRAVSAVTWLEGGAPGMAQFGPLAGGPKVEGTPPAGVAYSPDGKRLVFIPNYKVDPDRPTGRPDPVKATHWIAQVWGGGSGEPIMILPHGTDPVTAVAWSPDGGRIATGDATGIVVLWDSQSGKLLWRLSVAKHRINALAFSPDRKTLAAAAEAPDGAGGQVVLSDPSSFEVQAYALEGFPIAPTAIAFAPDGRTLIVGCGPRGSDKPGPDNRKKLGEVRILTAKPEPPKPQPAALDGWKEKAVLTQHAGPVDSVAFAPDGKRFVSAGANGNLIIWDAATLKPQDDKIRGVFPPGKFSAVAISPDGKLGAETRDKATGFFDLVTGNTVLMKPNFPGGRGVAFSPDGKWVATSDGSNTGFRSLGTGGEASLGRPGELEGHFPTPVAWSADSLYLAHIIPTDDGNWLIGIMGVTPETKPKNLSGHQGKVTAVAWSKDGKRLASGGSDGTVILWEGSPPFQELRRGKFVGRDGGPTQFHHLAFSPDGRTLAASVTLGSGKSVDRVILTDPESLEVGAVLFPPVPSAAGGASAPRTGPVWPVPPRTVAFSPDGRLLLAACGIDRSQVKGVMTPDEMKAAGAVVVWERAGVVPPAPKPPEAVAKPGPERNDELWVWQKRPNPDGVAHLAVSLAFAPDGKVLLTANRDGAITPWAVESDRLRASISSRMGEPGPFPAVAVAPDGLSFAVGGRDGVKIANLVSRTDPLGQRVPGTTKVLEEISEKGSNVTAVAYSPDGKRVGFSNGRTLWVRDLGLPGGVEFGPLTGVPAEGDLPAAVAFASDGKRVLFLPNAKIDPAKRTTRPGPDTTHYYAQLWGAGSGESMEFLIHGTRPVTCAAWSADGKRIATADDAGSVVIWDGETFKERNRLKLSGPVTALSLSKDGRRFAAGVAGPAKDGSESAVRIEVWTIQDGSPPDNWMPSSTLALRADESVLTLALSPDGLMLAATVWVRTIARNQGDTKYGLRVWDRVKLAPK
jgi:WD40 repeat protein